MWNHHQSFLYSKVLKNKVSNISPPRRRFMSAGILAKSFTHFRRLFIFMAILSR